RRPSAGMVKSSRRISFPGRMAHQLSVASLLNVKNSSPFGEKISGSRARRRAAPAGGGGAGQNLAGASVAPEASLWPSGENATDQTSSLCPFHVPISLRVIGFLETSLGSGCSWRDRSSHKWIF